MIKGRKHLAPPPCPGAEEQVGREVDRNAATEFIGGLRRTLASLKAGDTRVGLRRVESGPINIEYWGSYWKKNNDFAQGSVTRSGDPGLQIELDALNAEWRAFVSAEERSQPKPVAPKELTAAALEPKARANGRVRLRLKRSEGVALIDEAKRVIAPQPFKLLCFLAERTKQHSGYVGTSDIENHLWEGDFHISRPIRDVIRDLRNALEGPDEKRTDLRALIEQRSKLGYRLALANDEIDIV
jgi:hypothetical protein